MDNAALKNELIEFISTQLISDGTQITEVTPLISSSLIDSMGLVSLTLHLEKKTGKKIPATDVRKENWDTVNQIVEYLSAKGMVQ